MAATTTDRLHIGLAISLAATALFFATPVRAIECYQCVGTDSSHPFQCNEVLGDSGLRSEPCVKPYGAKFCVKHVGRFEGAALLCYQCTTGATRDCSDGAISTGGLVPAPCDHVFEARYCIKKTGGIGTKRFCSSRDLGNYCDYVRQPGDTLEYRSCLYTCTGDGCNAAATPGAARAALLLAPAALALLPRL